MRNDFLNNFTFYFKVLYYYFQVKHEINTFKNVILSAIYTSITLKTDNLIAVSALAQRLTCGQRVIKMNIKLN